jgi:ribonuclease E
LDAVIAAPLIPQEVPRQEESAIVAPAAEIRETETTSAPAEIAPALVAAVEAPAAIDVPKAVNAAEPPQQSTLFAAEAVAPVASQPAASVAAASNASNGTSNLDEVLRAAGLVLASTDPQKLRAAQEEAEKIVATPRAPRERKPLPPASTEPLVQMETKR